jgi:hypothetical protein
MQVASLKQFTWYRTTIANALHECKKKKKLKKSPSPRYFSKTLKP